MDVVSILSQESAALESHKLISLFQQLKSLSVALFGQGSF